MPDLKYVEPGVYVSAENAKKTLIQDGSVQMYPLIVGRIPKYVPKTLTIMRACGSKDPENNDVIIEYDKLDPLYADLYSIVSIKNAYNSAKSYSAESHCFEIVRDEKNKNKIVGFKWYPYSAKKEYRTYPGYRLLTTKPDGWDEDPTSYFVREGDGTANNAYKYTNVAEGAAWEINKYYIADEDYYTIDEDKTTYIPQTEKSDTLQDATTQESENSTLAENIKVFIYPSIDNIEEGLVPEIGALYKIKIRFEPGKDSEYYSIQYHTKKDTVVDFYGEDTYEVDYTEEGVGYNPLPVAAAILKEGGSESFYTLGIREPEIPYMMDDKGNYVKPDGKDQGTLIEEAKVNKSLRYINVGEKAGGYAYVTTLVEDGIAYVTVDGKEILPETINGIACIPAEYEYKINADESFYTLYREALAEKCADIEGEALYRIIPLNQGEKISKALAEHVNEFSANEERMECSGFTSLYYDPIAYTSYDDFVNDVMSLANEINSARIATSFGSATMPLSDEQEVDLSVQFMFVYLAALEQKKTDGTGLTNSTLPLELFSRLNTPNMRRSRKNEIAAAGVLIFEQRPSTAAIKVRHALTTRVASDMYGKELSVQYNIDYTKKYLRNICNPYIGRRNVNAETLELVEETIVEGLETLVTEGRLTAGNVHSIGVSEDSPDTIVVTLKIKVSFPLNYIYITLLLDN